METLHQTSLHMGWVVGLEVEVPVCVCGFSVDSNVQTSTLPPPGQSVQERKGPIFFHSTVNSMVGRIPSGG